MLGRYHIHQRHSRYRICTVQFIAGTKYGYIKNIANIEYVLCMFIVDTKYIKDIAAISGIVDIGMFCTCTL